MTVELAALGKAKELLTAIASKRTIGFLNEQFVRRGSDLDGLPAITLEGIIDEALGVLARDAQDGRGIIVQWLKGFLSDEPGALREQKARVFAGDPVIAGLLRRLVANTLRELPAEDEIRAARQRYEELFANDGHEGEGPWGETVFVAAGSFILRTILAKLAPSDLAVLNTMNAHFADARADLEEMLAGIVEIRTRVQGMSAAFEAWSTAGVPLPGSRAVSGLVNVPTLARSMVVRDEMNERLLTALTADGGGKLISLVGAGGMGKSAIATMFASHPGTLAHFPDGIFWVSVGQDPDYLRVHAHWLAAISDRPAMFTSTGAATAFLSGYFQERRALLVFDDAWTLSDIRALQVGGPLCSVLITTRERAFAELGELIDVPALVPDDALKLVRLRIEREVDDEEPLHLLLEALENHPLALELAAKQLSLGLTTQDLLQDLSCEMENIQHLDMQGFEFEADAEIARNRSLHACLNLSISRLQPDMVTFLARLAAARPGSALGSRFAERMCAADRSGATRALQRLWSMSLLELVSATGKEPRYRLHSIVRAKALSLIEDHSGAHDAVAARTGLLREYLRRCNPGATGHWHAIEDDEHCIDNLVYYLCLLDDVDALTGLMKASHDGVAFSPNAWHRLRIDRVEEDRFIADIVAIHDHFRLKAPACESHIEGLVRSYLILVSLADMNQHTDETLAVSLLKAGLWTQGQVASHAKRHFGAAGLARIVPRLAEPLHADLMAIALRMPQSGTSLVRIVEASLTFDEDARKEILAKVCSHLVAVLGTESHFGLSAQRLEYLRGALVVDRLVGLNDECRASLAGWIDEYLSHAEAVDWKSSSPFRDRDVHHQDRDIVALLDMVLHLVTDGAPETASRARLWATTMFETWNVREFAAHRLKLAVIVADVSPVVCAALDTLLRSPKRDYYWFHRPSFQLGDHDGPEGLAALMVEHFERNDDMLARLHDAASTGPYALACLSHWLKVQMVAVPREQVLERLARIYPGLIDGLSRKGRILPGTDPVVEITRGQLDLFRILIESRLLEPMFDQDTIYRDCERVSGDMHRARLFETALCLVDAIDPDRAWQHCSVYRHHESAASAMLAAGARLDERCRRRFVNGALKELERIDAPSGLAILSRHVQAFSGENATELARLAARLSQEIGDSEALRHAFARSGVAIPTALLREMTMARHWFIPDTLPTHAPLTPLPRAASLVSQPFWEEDVAEHGPGEPGNQAGLLQLLVQEASSPQNDRTRVRSCHRLADISQELCLRGHDDQSKMIAGAIADTARMYR